MGVELTKMWKQVKERPERAQLVPEKVERERAEGGERAVPMQHGSEVPNRKNFLLGQNYRRAVGKTQEIAQRTDGKWCGVSCCPSLRLNKQGHCVIRGSFVVLA